MSSYRPSYNGGLHYDDVPPPPPLPDSPPPPPSSLYPSLSDRGMRDSWRPSAPVNRDFTFRSSVPGPAYPGERDSYPNNRDRPPQDRKRQAGRSNDHRNLNPANRNRPQYGRGGKRIPIKASSRPLLSKQHGEDADMEMLGVDVGAAKYLGLEDVVDSDDEESLSERSDRSTKEWSEGFDGAADDESVEPPSKRRNVNQTTSDEPDKPKWCNPDPYSEYAPVLDDASMKKKDPVETIRKYRKIDSEKPKSSNQVADNDDFISFDLGGEAPEELETKRATNMPVAPVAPKTMLNGRQEVNGGHSVQTSSHIIADNPKSHDFVYRTTSQVPEGFIVLDTRPGSFRHESERYDEYAGAGRNYKRDHTGQARGQAVQLPSNDGLIEDWWPATVTNPLPWLNVPRYITAKRGLRLHMELCDFFDFVKPQKFEEAMRENLIDRIQTLVDDILPNCRVQCFGSFASGLYLPNADMDLVVMSDSYVNDGPPLVCQTGTKLFNFGNMIKRSGIAKDGSVTVIPKAKVPLIKFVDRKTNIKVDVSFENNSGVIALGTFDQWKRKYPAMPIIVTIIKQFLLMRAQNEVQHGGIGGFTVTCLVTSLLQNMPRVQSGELVPEAHLGEMLIEFLDFYGNRFDVSRTGITMEPPGYFDKIAYNRSITSARSGMKPSQVDRIAILDPNRAHNDISGGSKNVLSIFEQFSKAHGEILESMRARDRPSLLDWMLGGNYTDVMRQRNFLRDLYYSDANCRSHSLQGKVTAPSKPPRSKLSQQPRQIDVPQREASKESELHPSHLATQRNDNRLAMQPVKPSQAKRKPLDADVVDDLPDRSRAIDLRERFPNRKDIPPKVTKEQARRLISKKELGEDRARKLRRDYPAMSKIPNQISKVRRLQLIQKHEDKEKRSGLQANDMVLTNNRVAPALSARHGLGIDHTDVTTTADTQANGLEGPLITGPRFVALNHVSGSSDGNPIQLD